MLSESRMLWFVRTTPLSQSLFAFPLIGMISGYQAILILGIGLPLLFGTMHATGDITYAAVPFAAMVAFAMVRPPVLSYEGRLFYRLKFLITGPGSFGPSSSAAGRKGKGKGRGIGRGRRGRGSRAAGEPSRKPRPAAAAGGGSADPAARPATGREPMTVRVSPDSPVEVAITLRTREGKAIARKKVRILLDGNPIRTVVSSSSGEVAAVLDPEECIGRRTVAARDIVGGDRLGDTMAERVIDFVRM